MVDVLFFGVVDGGVGVEGFCVVCVLLSEVVDLCLDVGDVFGDVVGGVVVPDLQVLEA